MIKHLRTYFSRFFSQSPAITVGRIGLVVFSLTLISIAVYRYYGVGGSYETAYQFADDPTSISEFSPAGRALARETNNVTQDHYQRIVGDLVYFTAKLPSAYPNVTVTIEYQNPYQPQIDLGLKLSDDATSSNYEWKTIQHTLIDQWSGNVVTGSDGLTLLQPSIESANATGQLIYESVDQFLAEPPQLQKSSATIATLQAGIDYPFTLQDAPTSRTEYAQKLQGMQEFYVYIANGDFDFSVSSDAASEVPITVRLRRFGETMIEGDRGVQAKQLSAGVYEVQVIADPETIIHSISTSSPYLMAKGKLQLAANADPTTVQLLGNTATVIANDVSGLGEFSTSQLGVATGTIITQTIGVPVKWRNPLLAGRTDVSLLGGITILSDGPIAVLPNSVFDPRFGIVPLTAFTSPDTIDYVLYRDYVSPVTTRGWTEAVAQFDLTKVSTDTPGHLQFALSLPGIDTQPQGLTVRKVTVRATKEPITFKNLWQRIKNKL